MRWLFSFLLFFSFSVHGQNNLAPIGMWREHLPYQTAIDVTASDKKIYSATLYSLFTVDIASREIERLSKISGLSETGISRINYDPLSKKLFVAYTNSNIDVLDQKGIHNMPELKRETISGDKTIYHIYPDNQQCYLSTGLGVIVLDAEKYEIKDSWFIGNSGGFVKTNAFVKANNVFYAATEEGLKRTAATANAADFRSWQTVSGSNGLSSAPCKAVVSFQNKVIALQNDSLFVQNGSAWNLFFTNAWPITSINISENKLMVNETKPSGAGQVVVLNVDGTVQKTILQPDIIAVPRNSISVNNEYWVADFLGGLSHWQGNSFEQYKPNSPGDIAYGRLTVYNNIFYATAGSINDSWNYQYNRSGIFKMADDFWTNYNQFFFRQLDTLMDFITVAVDPRDETVWGGSYGGGLLHIKANNTFDIYKQNSPIGGTVGDPSSYRVSGLAFDADNNLWVSNFGSTRQLHVLKNNNTWQSFTAPFTLTANSASQIIIDDANQKWISSPLGNGLLVFNDNNTVDNVNDDKWKLLRTDVGSGNLPSNEVLCLAKDKNGFMWVGTENGIGVIECPEQIFSSACEAVWPVIKEGSFANYLFKGEAVQSIAVDGADRKWIGTQTGAWLVNAEGDKVLAHFTEENSLLLGNNVKSIAISGKTGEVFFATTKGISSYRAEATEAAEDKGNVLVFPNPVPPGYPGSISIKGLPENSFVKITETNGRLVYQSRSLGGQITWNGKDYKGNRVGTGVYIVLVKDETKQEKAVTKIVFIK